MKERVCCVYDLDENYVVKLSDYINSRNLLPYKTLAFTSWEELQKCKKEKDIELLISGETVSDDICREDYPMMAILTEEASDYEKRTFCKYQATEHLVKEIVANTTSYYFETGKSRKTRKTAIYSPASKCFKTTVALGYAHYKAMSHKVLYINFEIFAGLGNVLENNGKSLSDVIYYFLSDRGECISRILSCTGQLYGFEYIFPVTCPEDIADMSAEELLELLELICESEVYDEIVIDMGNMVSKPWIWLEHCDHIIMPLTHDQMDVGKIKDFEEYVDKSGFANIKERIRKITPGYSEDIAGKKLSVSYIMGPEMERIMREFCNES